MMPAVSSAICLKAGCERSKCRQVAQHELPPGQKSVSGTTMDVLRQ